eukprot:TRINITY_DN554_c0_g1_i2.p1 TRINITY_DN554_c0_g1~~TRINITY_DN554_c0_g1_i2.p1  ORF type:complete len:1501 (-),score=719.32 TRINITY_DN554_c0_g1_i2:125-4627(-)
MSNPNNKPAFNNDGNVKKNNNKGRGGNNNNNNNPRNPPPAGRGQQPNKGFNNNATNGPSGKRPNAPYKTDGNQPHQNGNTPTFDESNMNGVANGEVKSPQPQSPMHQPQAQGSNRSQPTLSPHSQDFVPSRTLSAPPDLKEQMKGGMVYTPFKTNYLQGEQAHNYQYPEGAPIQFGQHPMHPTQPLPIHPHMAQPGPVHQYTPPKGAPLPIHPADMAAAKKQPHLQPPINAGPPPGQGPGPMQGPMGMVPPHYPPHMRPPQMNPVPPNNLNPMAAPFMPPANVYPPVVGYPPQPYYPMQPQVGMPPMQVPGTPPNNFAPARPKLPTPPKKVIRIWDPNTGEDLNLADANKDNANNAANNTTANPKTTTGAGNILPELGGAMQTPKEDKPKPSESTKSPLMEVPKETGLKPPIRHAITHKPEEKKSEPVKTEDKKDETPAPSAEIKKDEPKKEVPKPVEPKVEEPKKEVPKEEVKPKVEEPKKEEVKVEEPKKDVTPKEEPKPVETKLVEPVKIVEEPKKSEDKTDNDDKKDDEDNWEKKDEEQLTKEIKEKKLDATMTLPGASSNKKIYGRDFLLQFQSQFTDKPATLRPDVLNVILGGSEGGSGDKTPRGQDRNWRGGQGRGGNLARSRDSLSSSGTMGQTPKGDRKGRGGRGGGSTTPRGKKRPDLNASQEPKVKDKSLWSRPEKATDEHTELTRKVQSLLNKLTLDKFEVISAKLLTIKVDTLSNLRLVINLLYDKAIIEPKFCTMYAELCKKLSEHYAQLYPEKDEDPERTLKFSFRRVLLTKCQTEFETKKQLPSLDDAKDPQQKLELEIEASKIRARNKGNIKFIGELYKKRMLTENIMHGCLKTLLGNGSQGQNEEDLENFCDLMSNIGGQLDAIDKQKMTKDYFDAMKVLAKSSNIILRIRFALEAVMKLRETGWKSRVDNTPKTIKQVHEEAAQKEREQLARERETDRQRRNVGKTKRPSATGGWAEVTGSGSTSTGRGKAPAPAPILREGIGRGSPVVPRAADKTKTAPPQSSGKNIFSALADSGEAREKPRYDDEDEYSGEEEVPKYQIKKRPAAVAPPPESDEEDEEDEGEEGERPKRYQPTRVASSAPPPEDEEDEEDDEESLVRGRGQYSNSEDEDESYDEEQGGDLESTLDNTLRDFIDDPNDIEAVVRDLKPLARDDRARNDMLDKMVLIAIEGAEVNATRVTEVLAATHRAALFETEQITEAFNRVVDQLGDLALDLPKATTLLPVILARGLADGWLNKSSLGQRINQLSSQEESDLHLIERFVGDIARQLVALKGAQEALKMFNDTQIKVSQVLEQNSPEAVSKFYQSAGLPVTAPAAAAPAPAPKKKKNEYKEVAAQFKKESKPSAIQNFIKAQSPEVKEDPDFVSKLVDCVLALCDQQNSLSHQSFDQKTFNKFKSTFTNYKDLMLQLLGRDNVQLAVLQQIQTFVSKNSYPAAFVAAIFELLFQHRLASAPAFNTWAKSADADTLAELNKADWFKKIVA